MIYVAGIDGGGTRTTLELRRLDGQFLKRKEFGPFNRNGINETQFAQRLEEIFSFLSDTGDARMVCIGAAGSSNPAMRRAILNTAERYQIRNVHIVGDQEIALYGAMKGQEGAVLIAGTGSICMGRGSRGETVRAGGNGHLIDDEGSGYALGRDALRAIVRAWDGRACMTILTGLVENEWEISGREQLIECIYRDSDKSRIAALAPLVEKAALAEDEAAMQILENGARELTLLVRAVQKTLAIDPLPLSLLGGLLRRETILKKLLLKKLKKDESSVLLTEPGADAAAGAALWALSLMYMKNSD